MKIMTATIFKSKDTVTSKPTAGKYKIVNIYVDPNTGKLTVEYEIP